MRRALLAALLLLTCLWTSAARALPCVPGTLDAYLLLGPGGCTVDALLFADFERLPGPTGSAPFADISVAPLTGAGTGLQFFPTGATAAAGTFLDEVIAYTVTALGAPVTGAQVRTAGATATGTGNVTAVNDLCLGGLFLPGVPFGCSTLPATLIAVTLEGLDFPFDAATFAPVTLVHAFTDIGVDAGPAGMASLTSVSSTFTTGAAVPEPPVVVLAFAALALAAMTSRKAFRRPRT
jgi:hypothetical protein